jgi:3-hydroxybutyryl-CoA dehydrogenase
MHGRKSGRGYYSYDEDDGRPRAAGAPAHRPDDPPPLAATAPARGEGVIVLAGEGVLADELRHAAAAAGYEVRSPHDPTGGVLPALIVECDRVPDRGDMGASEARPTHRVQPFPQGGAQLILCAAGSLAALDGSGSAVGFHVLPPLKDAALVELTRGEGSSPLAAARAERFFATLGRHVVWVGDAPGLVLGRIACQVINECAFALGEGVGSAADIDAGMVMGLNHPRGPLAWADEIGLDVVLGLLDALCDEYREERYRPAPALRRLVRAGRLGRASGSGFFEYGDGA